MFSVGPVGALMNSSNVQWALCKTIFCVFTLNLCLSMFYRGLSLSKIKCGLAKKVFH